MLRVLVDTNTLIPHDYFASGDKDFQTLDLPTYISVRELLQKIKTNQTTHSP